MGWVLVADRVTLLRKDGRLWGIWLIAAIALAALLRHPDLNKVAERSRQIPAFQDDLSELRLRKISL
jgi:hypothetical protein